MKNNKKLPFKLLSIFLAMLMVIAVIPMGAYASETEETELVQVSELKKSRDLYSKTYETSEDTNVVISAAVPLHYEEDGELKDIDNTLVKSETDSSVLTNTANVYNVELPNKYTDNSEIKLDYEDNSISFKLINDVKSSKGNIAETEKVDVDETNAESVAYDESNIDKLSSSITYENIMPDTDFEYDVQPDALKENIILNKIPDADYTVQYELGTGNLNAVLNDNNTITLSDGDKEVFVIEAPYMIDTNDSVSEDVTVKLEKSGEAYVLTYAPDYSWLSSKDVVYPVIIDPTVKIVGDKTNKNIEDTFVTTSTKTKNKSTMTTVSIQNSSTQSWGYYNIKILPELPDNSKITNCSLNLFTTTDVSTPYNLSLYPITEEATVNETYISSVTWNNKIDPADTIVDLETTPKNPDKIYFDITNLANKWYQHTDLNRILVLKALNGTLKTTIAASEYTSDTNKLPYLSIEYTLNKGIDSNNQYHTQDNGLAGTSYINDYTGKLIVERKEFTSNGSAGDITIYMGEGVNTPENNYFGENVSINYYQTLVDDKLNENSEYILTKGDGSREYISNGDKYTIDTSNENQIIISYVENNNLIKNTFSSAVNPYNTGKDSSEVKYLLIEHSVTQNSENNPNTNPSIVTINYNDNKILSITDEINLYEFEYSNGILLNITATPSSGEANDNEGFIIEDCNGVGELINTYTFEENSLNITLGGNDSELRTRNISYNFNENKVTRVTDETGLSYKYTYNDNNQVTKVQEFATDGTAGDYLTFEYSNNTTTISDGKNTYTEYFDLSGKLVSVVDQDGNATFAQYKDNLISKISETRNSARNIADFYGFESGKDSFFKTNNGTAAVTSDTKFNGNSSVQLTAPAQTKAVFDSKIKHLDKNSTYTISMWINKDEKTDCSLTLTNGDSNGIFTTVNAQTTDGWQQFYCTIDTDDSTDLNVALTVDNSTLSNPTTVYIDNMYIQKSPYLTNINLLKNGDFSDGLNEWTTSNENYAIVTEDANISTADNNRLKLFGDYLSENTISQTVPITAAKQGTKYTYGGWLKTVDALPAKEESDREISLSVYGIGKDGSNTLLDKTTYSSYLSNWQYIESELTLPDDNITQLNFVVNYNYQTGYAMFDGLSLSQDELYTIEFEYDGDDIKSIVVNGTTVSSTESDEDKEDSINPEKSYEYDDYGNVSKITETATVDEVSKSIISKFEYSNKGSLLTKELGALGRWTNYKYDYFGNVASVTDANGNEVQYEYDNFQNLSAIINQFESNYIHSNNREDKTETAETFSLKVQYTYTGNRLDKIETGNIEDNKFIAFNTYAFEYDKWGNQTAVYINDMENPYIHYDYDKNNYHQLNSVSYINGQKINYIYDDDGNIIYEYDSDNKDGDTLSYSYYYYDNSTCYGKKNLITGTVESYQDGLTTVKNSDGSIRHVYGYDENGNLLEQIGNNFVKVEENDNSVETTVNNNKNIIETKYDDFGRVKSEKFGIKDAYSYILKEYTYYDNNEENDKKTATLNDLFGIKNKEGLDVDADTTNLIRYLTYYAVSVNKDNVETKTIINQYRYLYTFDGETLSCTVASNTDGEFKGVDNLSLYAYNSSNMLTASSMYLYNYDNHGNISNVELNRDEEAETSLNFTYDENSGTALNNCLTNIEVVSNGESLNMPVSNDALGNINKVDINQLTNGIMKQVNFNWERGNTLDSISLEASNLLLSKKFNIIDYNYDDNNLRTHKSIDISGVLAKAIDAIGNNNFNTQDILSSDSEPIVIADMDYIWKNGQLSGEEIECTGSIFAESDKTYGSGSGKYSIVILYDQDGNAYGLTVNKTEDSEGNAVSESQTFYYLKDTDNTIKAIIDERGNKLVTYEYDSYGMLMEIDNKPGYRYLMLLNPLAYRDYIYDIETGMYYLQSRYYAPYIGRFISADSVLDTGSGTAMCTHLYSYCENNPINNIDPYGYAKINVKWIDVTIDLLIIVIPVVGEVNSTLAKAGKPSSKIISKATSIFSKYSSKISGFISSALKKVCSKSLAASISSAVVKGLLKAMTMFTIFSSIGNFIEYIIDCLDGSWNGYLDTSKKLKLHIITKKGY